MAHTLYVVHGSHPCATVRRALELKGIAHKVVEWPPALHAAMQRMLFGARTVPALRLEGGERISGSRAILRRLDELAPDPPLLPADAQERAAVLRAEEWGDEVLQPIARRVLWSAFAIVPRAMASYQVGSRLPAFPMPVLLALAPGIVRVERRLNEVSDEAVRADLRALPGHLDRVDRWIGEGLLGGKQPNAADLQIAATIRLLRTIGDVAPLIAGRPCEELALRLFPTTSGFVPAGAYPDDWLPVPAAPVSA